MFVVQYSTLVFPCRGKVSFFVVWFACIGIYSSSNSSDTMQCRWKLLKLFLCGVQAHARSLLIFNFSLSIKLLVLVRLCSSPTSVLSC